MVDIYLGADGCYHAFVPVGYLPDGRVDRRHRQAKTEAEVLRKVRELQEQVKAGNVAKPGRVPLLSVYLTEWVNDPAAEWRYNTQNGSYAWAVDNWLIPGIGVWRMDLLDAPAIEDFLRGILRTDEEEEAARREGRRPAKLSMSSVHAVFRVLRAALNDAVRKKIIPRNPMDFMTWRPKLEEEEVTPLFVDEVKAILRVCEHRRNGTRWTIGLPLGLRQGEALGLPWWVPPTSTRDKPMGLDTEAGWLVVRRKAERRKWQHGCTDPVQCARPKCRTTPCPPRWQHGCGKDPADCTKQRVDRCPKRIPRPDCATHRDVRNCAKLCQPGCTGHASTCPQRRDGGIVFTDTKSDAGRRRIALAKPMCKQAKAHRKQQDRERTAAGETWQEFGLVWCQPNGRPIDARDDWEDWKEILQLAGVRDARVHDGRHTAATMLLLQGVDEITVMAVMGWSDRRMLRRYQHVIDELRVEASRRVGALLWDDEPKPKKRKKNKKKRDQVIQTKLDISPTSFATDHATGDRLAKVIPFPTSA